MDHYYFHSFFHPIDINCNRYFDSHKDHDADHDHSNRHVNCNRPSDRDPDNPGDLDRDCNQHRDKRGYSHIDCDCNRHSDDNSTCYDDLNSNRLHNRNSIFNHDTERPHHSHRFYLHLDDPNASSPEWSARVSRLCWTLCRDGYHALCDVAYEKRTGTTKALDCISLLT